MTEKNLRKKIGNNIMTTHVNESINTIKELENKIKNLNIKIKENEKKITSYKNPL
jgi:hypothetical protein